MRIRRAVRRDHERVYAIAVATGNNGGDASALHRHADLIGDIYAGPYLEYPIASCFVLVDANDEPLGYVVAVPDTTGFEDWLDANWWPRVRVRVSDFQSLSPADADLVARVGHRSPISIVGSFPAHGHINLVADARGGGHGRQLMSTVMDSLGDAGAPAMHLEVGHDNLGALAFYERLGFDRVLDDGESVFVGRSLTSR